MEQWKANIARWIVSRQKRIIVFFVLLAVASIFALPYVKIAYNLTDYIPEKAPSTIAIHQLQQDFQEELPNADVMVKVDSIGEALEYKQKLSASYAVKRVLWLDDVMDLRTPLEVVDNPNINSMYQQGQALFMLTMDLDQDLVKALADIRSIIGSDGAVRGQLVEYVTARSAVEEEITRILLFMIPLVLIILFISTTSWFSPILFICTILLAVLFNMGTNVFMPQVSFITQSVSAALQLAVTIDYMIFLLHAFEKYTRQTGDSKQAMRLAVSESFSSIMASSVTTICGFLALIFMRFRIGADLGIVLAKGIFFSLLSVLVLLPALILLLQPLLQKTAHRSFVPKFRILPRLSLKIRYLTLLLLLVLLIPAFRWQSRTDFQYGMGEFAPGSQAAVDKQKITDVYGESYTAVLLVPRSDPGKEVELISDLQQKIYSKSLIGYATEVGRGLPIEVLPDSVSKNLFSEHYSRYFWQIASPLEKKQTFEIVADARATVAKYYPEIDQEDQPEGAVPLMAGANFSIYDLRDCVKFDGLIANGLAILTVGLVILITFRNWLMPLILLLTIEFAIWTNLSIPYLLEYRLSYIGYLVISTVQLGATVDYGILLSRNYLVKQSRDPEAIIDTLREYLPAVILPALILATSGYILSFVSSIKVVSELGQVLGRGALFSLASVIFILPALWFISRRWLIKSAKE